MTSPPAPPPGRRLSLALVPRAALALLVGAALAAGALLSAAPASAHDQLLRTSPADGASADGPRVVSLTFSEAVLDVKTANRIVVTGPSGVVAGTLEVDGAVLRLTFEAPLPGGAYQVRWRAASDDGHPVSGHFAFTSTAAAATPTTASATATASTTTSDSTTSASSNPLATDPTTDDRSGGAGWWLVIGLVALAVVCAGAIVLARRRAATSAKDGS